MIKTLLILMALYSVCKAETLETRVILPPTAVPANGTPYMFHWQNTLGRDIMIERLVAYPFVDSYYFGFFGFGVQRHSDRSRLIYRGWHVRDPLIAGPNDFTVVDDYGSNCFLLLQGDTLDIQLVGKSYTPQQESIEASFDIYFH